MIVAQPLQLLVTTNSVGSITHVLELRYDKTKYDDLHGCCLIFYPAFLFSKFVFKASIYVICIFKLHNHSFQFSSKLSRPQLMYVFWLCKWRKIAHMPEMVFIKTQEIINCNIMLHFVNLIFSFYKCVKLKVKVKVCFKKQKLTLFLEKQTQSHIPQQNHQTYSSQAN